MANPIDELAQREMAVLAHAATTVGLMQDKERWLREDGTFAEAASIHDGYVALASPPASDLEALKRAVFLSWYQVAEPGCFTGIGDLHEHTVTRSFQLLEDTRLHGSLDREFEVMLGWYWQVAEFVFGGYLDGEGRPHAFAPQGLLQYLPTLNGTAYKEYGFQRADLEHRGQMGDYWISIACRPA